MLRALLAVLMILQNNHAFAANWIAFGDLRGNMEPCGCDPASDLGGMLRLGAFVNQVKQIDRKTLVLIVGKSFSSESKNLMQNQSVAQAMSALKVSAALPSSTEDIKYFSDQKIPFVLTNSKDVSHARSKVENDLCILGFSKIGQEITDDFLKKNLLAKGLCDGSTKSVIILTDLTDPEVSKLITAYSPLTVVRASSRDISIKPDGSERQNPDSMVVPIKGVTTMQVPLGGAGVWVSENLFQVISHIKSVFSKNPGCASPSKTLGSQGCGNREPFMFKSPSEKGDFTASRFSELPLIWLDKSYNQKPSLVDEVMKKYRDNQHQKFKEHVSLGLKDLKKSDFVGSASCKSCHQDAYEVWKNSKHAKAIEVLIEAKKNEEFECVGCHVVGYGEKGGYLDEKHTPHLSSVGCENCHGPGKDHVNNPIKNATKGGRYVCTNCHVDGHSPQFDLGTYWPQIKHGKNPAPSAK